MNPNSPAAPGTCPCETCQRIATDGNVWWLVVCPQCGSKRCPHAIDHGFACTGSNELNQTPEIA